MWVHSGIDHLPIWVGLFEGTMDYYFGPRVRSGVQAVQLELVKCHLWPADKVDGVYSEELRQVWDGALRFGYVMRGR